MSLLLSGQEQTILTDESLLFCLTQLKYARVYALMEQGERTPLKLEFDSSFGYKEEFARRLAKTGMFSVKRMDRSYFSLVVESILRDEDPMPIISEAEPEMDGIPHMSLFVKEAASPLRPQSMVFVYDPDMTEEVFSHRCMEALCAFKDGNRKVILRNTGFYILRTLFTASDISKKELADAYFMVGNYESALHMYTRAGSTGVCRRMSEMCRVLLGTDMMGDPLAFDIMIFYRRYNALYAALRALPFDARLAAQYYLAKQELPQHMRILLEYGCCKGFSTVGDGQRLSSALDTLRRFASHQGASAAGAGRIFWRDCTSALESEFGVLGGAEKH